MKAIHRDGQFMKVVDLTPAESRFRDLFITEFSEKIVGVFSQEREKHFQIEERVINDTLVVVFEKARREKIGVIYLEEPVEAARPLPGDGLAEDGYTPLFSLSDAALGNDGGSVPPPTAPGVVHCRAWKPKRIPEQSKPREPNTPARVLAAVALSHGKVLGWLEAFDWIRTQQRDLPAVSRQLIEAVVIRRGVLRSQVAPGQEAVERMSWLVDRKCRASDTIAARAGRAIVAFFGDAP